ncbi:MAG: hypothetical protein ACYDHH_09285 [Solirubrobacteraceae bacterium]
MRKQVLRTLGLLRSFGGLALVAALGAALAWAAAGSADNSPLATTAPDLVSANATSARVIDACFDQALATTFNISDSNFYLQGYTESRKTGSAGALSVAGTNPDPASAKCVLVTLAPNAALGADARTYSRVVVKSGAVTSTSGVLNADDAVPLGGSLIPPSPLQTLRPTVINATAQSSTQVVYTFSRPIFSPNLGSFGFYNNVPGDAAEHVAGASGNIVSFTPGSTTVTVNFPTPTTSASRFVVDENAVLAADGQGNPAGAIGGATQNPDLGNGGGRVNTSTEAQPVYSFVFSQPILLPSTAKTQTGFELTDLAGNTYHPINAAPTLSVDGRTLTIKFQADPSDSSPDPNEITLESVAAGTVQAANPLTGSTGNSQGALGLPSVADHPGLTSGPDLLSFSINNTTGVVVFSFDDPLAGSPVNVSKLELVTASGGLIPPPNQCASPPIIGTPAPSFGVTGNTVGVLFAKPTTSTTALNCGGTDLSLVNSAVGVETDEAAVQAQTGQFSALSALGITPGVGTTGSTGSTGSTGTSGSTGTTGSTGPITVTTTTPTKTVTVPGPTLTGPTVTGPTVTVTTTITTPTPTKPKPKPKKHKPHKKKHKKHKK